MEMFTKSAKYHLGQIVRHKKHPFRGVVFDVDPEFSNTDEWYESIPEDSRPHKERVPPISVLFFEKRDQMKGVVAKLSMRYPYSEGHRN